MVPAIKEIRAETAYDALGKSCLDAVFDNQSMYFIVGAYARGWKWDDCIFDMGMRMCDLAHQNFIIQCKCVDDIFSAHREGKIALIPCFEACTMIENELDRLDILFGLGVRMMGIVYSEGNVLGSGLSENGDGGLTNFGRQAVKRLNDLGMAIDVSHCGDKTSMDVIEASSDPVFITHAGARGVWNSKRMKPDEVIIACAEKGGVIGIEAAPHTTFSDARPKHDIDSVFDHFQILRGPGGNRPRGLRAGHHVRRPQRAPRRAVQGAVHGRVHKKGRDHAAACGLCARDGKSHGVFQ